MTERRDVWVTGRPAWGRSKRSNRYGSAWQHLRKQILERDGHQCQLRLPDVCTGRASQVDHIISVADGGSDEPGNLRSVCRKCHARRTARQGLEARRRRLMNASPKDGAK